MSRTNHHQRNYKRWNITGIEVRWGWKTERRKVKRRYYDFIAEPSEWVATEETRHLGMELSDLRFYAGCRRQPELIHKRLEFYGRYPWRFHHGPGVAKPSADKWEGKLRGSVRQYVDEARDLYNAGDDWAIEDLVEPDLRPRSIEWDIW